MPIQSGYTKEAAANWDNTFLRAGPKVDFWRIGDNDCERDRDDAIDSWLSMWSGLPFESVPKTVQVEGYQRIPVDLPTSAVESMLESIYERLDDEHGDPDGGWTKPPDDVRQLATEFLTKVYRSYGVATWSARKPSTSRSGPESTARSGWRRNKTASALGSEALGKNMSVKHRIDKFEIRARTEDFPVGKRVRVSFFLSNCEYVFPGIVDGARWNDGDGTVSIKLDEPLKLEVEARS